MLSLYSLILVFRENVAKRNGNMNIYFLHVSVLGKSYLSGNNCLVAGRRHDSKVMKPSLSPV